MKRPTLLWLLIVGAFAGTLLLPVGASYADHHGRVGVFVGVGPGFWWGPPYPYWWGAPYPYWAAPPYPYYGYPPPYYYPPAGIVQQPQVYVQQAPPQAPPADWYYCSSAQAYFPQVQTCPEPWIRVPSRNP